MKRAMIVLGVAAFMVLLFGSAATAQNENEMGREDAIEQENEFEHENEFQREDELEVEDEFQREDEFELEDDVVRQGAMNATASASPTVTARATATPTATPTAAATAAPDVRGAAGPTVHVRTLPDTGGPSLAAPVALVAALVLVGSGVGILALRSRRAA